MRPEFAQCRPDTLMFVQKSKMSREGNKMITWFNHLGWKPLVADRFAA
jgi:hypothetical protein